MTESGTPPEPTEGDLDFARTLAAIGERIALEHHGRGLPVRTKPDGTPVTDADVAVERELSRLIERWRPNDAILGEELGVTTGANERRWIIDPIDGTANFIAGSPQWAVLVALEVSGMVVVGVMTAPVLGVNWWAARGHGAHRNGERLHVRREDGNTGVVVSRRAAHLAGSGDLRTGMAAVIANASAVDSTQTFWPELLVAEGVVDIDVSPHAGALWDLAPRQILVEEAGGVFSDLAGRRRAGSGSSLSCSSEQTLEKMLAPERQTSAEALAG